MAAGLGGELEQAIERVAEASPEALRQAVARMPSYQRTHVRWLARELALLAQVPPKPGGNPVAPGSGPWGAEVLRRCALERARLSRQIAECPGASTQDRAFMQQTLAHLWTRMLEGVAPVVTR